MSRTLMKTLMLGSCLAAVAAVGFGCAKAAEPAPAVDPGAIPAVLSADLKGQITGAKANPSAPATRAVLASLQNWQLEIPVVDLLSDTNVDVAKRNKQLARLNAQGRAMIATMKAQCQVQPGQSSTQGDFKVGGQLLSTSGESVGGALCPISRTVHGSATETIDTIDQGAGVFATHGTESSELQMTIRDSSLVARSGAKSLYLKGTSELRARGIPFKAPDRSKFEQIARVTGTGLLIAADDSRLTFDLVAEVIARADRSDKQVLMTLHHAFGDVVVGAIAEAGKTTFYVNGVRQPDELELSFFGNGVE